MKTATPLSFRKSAQHGARKLALATMLGLSVASSALASVSFFASGVNKETGDSGLSAEADVSLVGSTLTLTLSNTSGITKTQGDALTGILFNTARYVSLELSSITLTPKASDPNGTSNFLLWGSRDDSSEDWNGIGGSWTSTLAFSPRIPASFGVGTTGFNGEFNGNLQTGTSSPDYGIVAAGTTAEVLKGGSFPFVEDSLTFTMKVKSGQLSESDITGTTFLFGTNGQGWIQGSLVPIGDGNPGGGGQAPEPMSFVLLGTAAAAARFARRAR